MEEEKLLTVREASGLLGISEKEMLDLADTGAIPGYKIAGVYLRFKQQELEGYRRKLSFSSRKHLAAEKYSFKDRLSDFFYFNDFYILTVILVGLIIFVILKG